uniref:NADH-ubiquinone oxidoreductase chain 6 n=1 Tax=Unilepidotricha sp. 1 SJR-2024a TaxID=3158271 RepID=A0AAU7E5A8_9NEOP
MIFFSFLLFFLNHPLSMGFMILIQTFLLCLISGMLTNTYWFSYILFLTFLGGLLVLFIYVSTIASNEMFKFSLNAMILLLFLLSTMSLFTFMMNKLYWMNLSFNYEMKSMFENYLFWNNENKMNLSKLYNKQTSNLMMMLIIYLFITLIAVVKITNISFGPLRMNN